MGTWLASHSVGHESDFLALWRAERERQAAVPAVVVLW